MTAGWLHVVSVLHDNLCSRWKWWLTVKKTKLWLPHGLWQLKYNYLSSSKNISGWLASKACLKQTIVDFICICFSHHLCNGVVTLPTPEGPEQPHPSQNNQPWIHLANQFLPLPADNFRCFKRNGRLTVFTWSTPLQMHQTTCPWCK